MKNILIRANSSSKIGLGHIKRDLVLAKEFKNSTIIFAVENLSGNINDEIQEEYKVHLLKSNEIDELVKVIENKEIDLLIIDSYEITYTYEKELKQRTSCTLMVLDDTYEKHYCDILLNHNLYAQEEKYKNKVPKNCEVRCGEKYTLIRDEFKNYKSSKDPKIKNPKKTIMICMGGVDEKNISLVILKALQGFHINIIILTSSSNKNIKLLQEYKSENIDLKIDCCKMAELINEVDFAIVSPSVIVHELLYMKKEFISIQTAENQRYMHEYLRNNKFLAMSEFNEEEVKEYVNKLLNTFVKGISE